ncbi:MAG: carboxypeptidase-like regulatory domain-containing protein, partial [Planctomycetota bacterium]
MCEYPSAGKKWWQPDGSPLDNPPYDGSNLNILSGGKLDAIPIEFAFRLSGILGEPAWEARVKRDDQAFVWWTGRRAKDGKFLTNIKSIGMFVKSDQKTIDLRLGFSIDGRPHEWVEFENIYVKPNFETDVRAKDARSEDTASQQTTISGRCLDPEGRPLSDARVLVFSMDDVPALVAESKTDFRGQFKLGPVASLTEEDTGRRRYLVFVPPDDHGPAWKEIHNYQQSISLLELKTYEPAQVFGTIVTENSRPVDGAQVWVRQIIPPEATEDPNSRANDFFTPAPLPSWSTTTGSDGAFRIAGIVDGARIQLFVSHSDLAGSFVYVKPGRDVSIGVQPAAVITGRVLYGKTGQPAAGVKVQAQGVEHISIPGGMMTNWAQTVTDDQGRYELRSLGANKYNIWAQAEDFTAAALSSFKTEPGRTHQAPDILLVGGGFIAGRVVDETTGEPVKPGAASDVAIYGPSRPKSGAAVETSRIRQDGSFRIRVAPGRNYIYLRPMDDWGRDKAVVYPPNRWVNAGEGQTVEVEFKIRKYSQAELAQGRNRGYRIKIGIPKTIDEAEYEAGRMRRLGAAIAQYLRDHDQTLPETALELKPYMQNSQDLAWALEDVRYVLRGKLSQSDIVQRPIAYDEALLSRTPETYALFADFSVRPIGRYELEQLGVYHRPSRDAAMTDRWSALDVAMKTYAKEHDGRLPDTFDALKPYVVSERYFEWIVNDLEFLAPGRHLGLMQDWAPIACEKEQFEKDQFTAVLFSDGRRESMYPKEIRKLARLDGRSTKSAEILMRIGRAMLIYANDHGDKYPERLDELRDHLRANELAWASGRIEYLASGKTTAERPDAVTAYDAELLTEGKGTNVLFNDCHVEFADPERLRQWNISNAAVLIKIQIVTATDDFLKEMHLDANSAPVGEVKGGHSGDGSVAEPNSQPFLLLLDEIDERIIRKAIKAREG